MILIGGGSGFIGRALTQFYKNKGIKFLIISRNPKDKSTISWNCLKENGLPDNVTHVINLSGRNISEMSPLYLIDKNYQKFRKDLFDSRLETTKLLVDSIKSSKSPPKTFINASAIGFYKPSLTTSYTEDSVYEKLNFLTELCKKWEDTAQIPDMKQVRQIQLRIGLVLGSGGGMLQSMYLPFYLGLGGPIGSGQQWMPWIHINDIVGLIDWLLYQPDLNIHGPVNATAPHPVRCEKFVKSLGRALNRPAILPMPSFAVKGIFGERATMLLEGQKVLPKKALDNGYKFQFENVDDALNAIYH